MLYVIILYIIFNNGLYIILFFIYGYLIYVLNHWHGMS